MALELQPSSDRKRVKVYELRDNDWFDRGTGFCTGQILDDEPRIFVESEDEPNRVLLETRINKDDGYQKQQGAVPSSGPYLLRQWLTDASDCDSIRNINRMDGTQWDGYGTEFSGSRGLHGHLVIKTLADTVRGIAVVLTSTPRDFVNSVQQHMNLTTADDALSEDLESYQTVMLPAPELGNLPEIEQIMRGASMTQAGRDTLSKIVIRDDYVVKLLPLVTVAEDLESLADLHRLCNIMKSLILLNDNTIIENVVTDPLILGVVGALEYDPEFPTHKANHRQYLADESRFKEVVPIKEPAIRKKIRCTWRLQYLKDVVLARILDDPTFSVLNSLIFFNQVEILNYIQSNGTFLKELFSVFDPRNPDTKRKDDAVQFLHQCAAIAKNLQVPARANLFANFISHGLFAVIAFAVKHPKPAVRTTGIDVLVALLDHDPIMMRGYMLKAVNDKKTPLTDTLIDLLHTEADLGVKNQLADAIKVLLDPQIVMQDAMGRAGPDYFAKLRPSHILPDAFAQHHFDGSAKRLFAPLTRLENRATLHDLTFHEVALYAHLVDILSFFVRQNQYRSRNIIYNESLAPRIAQLLNVPQKHLKLTALKFFRMLVSQQDTFYQALLTHNNTFGLILDVVYETMPRDNLLNSACLEFFEAVRRDNMKSLVIHVVEKYRERLQNITYVDTFHNLIHRYEQMQGYDAEAESVIMAQDEARKLQANGQRWQGPGEMDAAEEAYFNTSDDEEDWQQTNPSDTMQNGTVLPTSKPLVDYPDDDDDDAMDTQTDPAQAQNQQGKASSESAATSPSPSPNTPPERLSEKRRREEEDEDELVKLTSGGPKRRSSTSSNSGSAGFLRRKKSVDKGTTQNSGKVSAPPKKISINLGSTTAKSQRSEKENRDA